MTDTPTPASEIEARLREMAAWFADHEGPDIERGLTEAADHIAALEARLREETEACAKIADRAGSNESSYYGMGREDAAKSIAEDIRARSILPTETE